MEVYDLHRRGNTVYEWMFTVGLINKDGVKWSPYFAIRQNDPPDLSQIKEEVLRQVEKLNAEHTSVVVDEETGEETIEITKPANSWEIR